MYNIGICSSLHTFRYISLHTFSCAPLAPTFCALHTLLRLSLSLDLGCIEMWRRPTPPYFYTSHFCTPLTQLRRLLFPILRLHPYTWMCNINICITLVLLLPISIRKCITLALKYQSDIRFIGGYWESLGTLLISHSRGVGSIHIDLAVSISAGPCVHRKRYMSWSRDTANMHLLSIYCGIRTK